MTIEYTENIDVLYIRLDDKPQQVANEEVDGVVLDIGEDNRIVGIEILDASKRLRLDRILPVHFRKTA